MHPSPHLSALLHRWEELRNAGQSITADELCKDHPELLQALRHRMSEIAEMDTQTNVTAVDSADTCESQQAIHASHVPTIPGYLITGELGRGGMGVVYQACDSQFDRDVAIKLLSSEVPAESYAVTRFRNEARITGQLQHPGIPAVHELGTLPDGKPFLAMKLVKGQTLQKLLEKRAHPQDDRGRLVAIFEHVCQAIGYAHAHSVLHRDLKPSNIMVGAFGEVQVMDWGLAKVLSNNQCKVQETENDTSTAAYVSSAVDTPEAGGSATRTGSVLGTPAFMPPEQAAGEIHKLDVRSDVFGLGAILCQILTGQPPYAGKDSNATRIKAVRGDLQDAFTRLDQCGAEPDLVALCKKCLAFGQEDRPADGQAVAEEVGRIRTQAEARARQAEQERAAALVREAEERKHRQQFRRAAIAITTVLVLGIIGTTYGLLEAQNLEEVARKAANEEKQAKQREALRAESEKTAKLEAEKNLLQAKENLAFARKGNKILGSVFDGLDPKMNYPTIGEFSQVLKDNLNKAVQELDGSAIGDLLTVAEMQNTLGLSLLGLGEREKAIILFEKAWATRAARLGHDNTDTISSMNNLATSQLVEGKPDKALPLNQEALKILQAKHGPMHVDTLICKGNIAMCYQALGKHQQAMTLYEEALEPLKDKLGPENPDTLKIMGNLAVTYRVVGKLDQAMQLYEETLLHTKARLGPEHPDTLMIMANLAVCYESARMLDKALPLFEEALNLRTTRLGPEHPDTLTSMAGLARCYHSLGKLDLAMPLYERTLKLKKARLGNNHPSTLVSMNNLAGAFWGLGKLDKSIPLFEETLKLRELHLGRQHPDTQNTRANLGVNYKDAGRIQEAIPLLEEACRAAPKYPKLRFAEAPLLEAYVKTGRSVAAATLVARQITDARKQLPPDSPQLAGLLAQHGQSLLQAKAFAESESLLRECLAIRQKQEPDAWSTFNTRSSLGGALLGQKKYAEAEPLLLKGYEGLKAREKSIPPQAATRLPEALDRLIQLYTETDKPEEVKKWQTERDRISKTPEKK